MTSENYRSVRVAAITGRPGFGWVNRLVTKRADGCWQWRGAAGMMIGHRREEGETPTPLSVRRAVLWALRDVPPYGGPSWRNTCGNRRCVNPDHQTAAPR
jgi:hypothetical protein